VLWHEQRILTAELQVQGDLLARLVALSAEGGGSPEVLAILSMTDLVAGEVRSADGDVLWRYGPLIAEVETLEVDTMRIDRQVAVAAGPWAASDHVDVTLLLSRSRLQTSLAGAAIRLIVALAIALAVAMTVGLWGVGRVVQPLSELAELSRSFDPGVPVAPAEPGGVAAELTDLATAFHEMTRRLSEQQRSLAASERRFRELFSSSPTPLLELDAELRLAGANPAAAGFLGVDPDAATGRPLRDMVITTVDEPWAGLISAVRATGEGVLDARWRLPDGELAEVEIHLSAAGDGRGSGFLAAIHDLTDRVRRLGRRWQQTFDAMIDGVALVGDDGAVEHANRALAPHLPALTGELARRSGRPGAWRTTSLDRLLECTLSRPRGLHHSILVARDVTEAVSAEARLREAEKMQAVATLASGVAHDFNNLIAAVLLHVRLLEAEPERATEVAAAIRELAEQGEEVVGELLLFARSDDSLPPRTFDLCELVRSQRAVLSHLLPPGVELELGLDDAPVPVVGNPVALRRLILNLVVNARDAVADAGGVITITVGRSGGRAELEVADTGPGIADEHRDRLFEPFFTLRRRGRGSGLGLAVVYAIASAHGGDVELVSGSGEGARFQVHLPPGDVGDLERLDDTVDATVGGRILLIEPDGRTAAGLLEVLADAGYQVRHASDSGLGRELVASWSPRAVVVRDAGRTDTDWLARLGLPVVAADRPVAEVLAELEALEC